MPGTSGLWTGILGGAWGCARSLTGLLQVIGHEQATQHSLVDTSALRVSRFWEGSQTASGVASYLSSARRTVVSLAS